MKNLLNDPTVSNFVTKKWIKVNDLSSGQHYMRFKTPMLRQICVIIVMHKMF